MAERIIVTEREPDPGQQWKCGDEFLPFHPQASHVPPEYRDGWNRCYWMAVSRGVTAIAPAIPGVRGPRPFVLPAADADSGQAQSDPKPVAYHDKDQPNGVAWCPGFPEGLADITPMYAGEKNRGKLGARIAAEASRSHAQSIDAETYNALACAAFAIKCLRDGINIGEKLPDAIQRIEALLARGVKPADSSRREE